jgi:hypothetical protein
MIPIKFDIVEKAIDYFKSDIEKQRADALSKLQDLKNKMNGNQYQNERNYVDSVIPLFNTGNNIITSMPTELQNKYNQIGQVPSISIPKRKPTKKQSTALLKDEILDCLGYVSLRNSFYPKFFDKIGIKACVYCNSQLTVVTKNKNGKFSARFDLDHYINKSDYPFLSISLYNLYPVCASCNRKKYKSTIPFDLYQEFFKPSDYHFGLNAGCVAKYVLSKNSDDISIRFEPNNNDFDKKLGINAIYNTQKDLVEEMIVKSRIYNKSYIATLKSSFNSLFQNPDLFDRVIYGNYMKEEDIHKRPMSKFIQDITKELKNLNS